jgi:hypothetical protein
MLANIITGPLDMPDTFAAAAVPPHAVLSQGHFRREVVPITAAADLKSSAQDMLTWMGAIHHALRLKAEGAGTTFLQEALAETGTVCLSGLKTPEGQSVAFDMGLAWQISALGGGPPQPDGVQIVAKNGATSRAGSSCWVGLTRYAVDTPPVGVALLTNQDGVSPDATGRAILEAIVQASLPPGAS